MDRANQRYEPYGRASDNDCRESYQGCYPAQMPNGTGRLLSHLPTGMSQNPGPFCAPMMGNATVYPMSFLPYHPGAAVPGSSVRVPDDNTGTDNLTGPRPYPIQIIGDRRQHVITEACETQAGIGTPHPLEQVLVSPNSGQDARPETPISTCLHPANDYHPPTLQPSSNSTQLNLDVQSMAVDHCPTKKEYRTQVCQMCGNSFKGRCGPGNLQRHLSNSHPADSSDRPQCTLCGKKFNRADNVQRHEKVCPYRNRVYTTTIDR